MKILTRKDQDAIERNLAVIYHCSSSLNVDFADEHEHGYLWLMAMALADVAYLAGGLKMMQIVPELAAEIRILGQEETEGWNGPDEP